MAPTDGDNPLAEQVRLLRKMADDLASEAAECEKVASLAAEYAKRGAELREQERGLRTSADSLAAMAQLPSVQPLGTVRRDSMDAQTLAKRNLAIAKAKAAKDDKLAAAARKKRNWSLRDLERESGIPIGSLCAYRDGDRAIPRKRYEKVKELIGFTDWPAGVEE